jgi:membrane protein DedA with SNARE-associated domain
MADTLHHILVSWMQFVRDWGYLGVFVLMALESTALPVPAEIVIPPAAYWAARGELNIWGVILAATAGSWTGSAASYWIAYKLGRPLVTRYGKYVLLPPKKLDKADLWFEAYGAVGIFIARLLPAIRHVISLPAGLFRMNFKKFSIMTIAGAGVFCAALAWFGMKVIGDQPGLMENPEVLIGVLKSKSHYLIGFALVVGALYGLMAWMQKRAAARKPLA